MVKYTFLLPVFKTKYLVRALGSILNQTYEDFEIIVSNDKSPEDILSIINNYHDERIKYRENDVNIGGLNLVNHWNLLLELCESPYLIMASDDDIYEDNFLADVDQAVKDYPNVDLIRSRTRRIDSNDRIIDDEVIYDRVGNELESIYNSFCTNQIWCIGNYVFKTEKLKRLGGFVKFPYAWFSDLATAMLMSKNGICNTSNFGFRFRLSDSNISNTHKNKKLAKQKLDATISYYEWLSKFMNEFNIPLDTLSQHKKQKIDHSSTTIIYSNIGDHGWGSGYFEMFGIYNRIKSLFNFSKMSFIKNYILAVLARRIGKYV